MNRRDLLKLIPAAGLAAPGLEMAKSGKCRLLPAICAYSFREPLGKKQMTYDDIVHLAQDLDIPGLDLTVYWFPNTTDSFLLPLRRLAYRSGIEIYSISVRTDLCKPTREGRDAEVETIRGWVDVANKLGASHIRIFGGNVPKGSTEDQASDWVVEILKRASEYSGARGVILGLENHGGITSEASRIVDMVKRVDSPWVGINLDTGNFVRNAYQQIEACLPYAVNAQYKVEIRDDAGQRQDADWDRLARMFAKASYRGYFALEYEEREDPRVATPPLLAKLAAVAKKYSGQVVS
ncbi:MAG: sugar phosphate isomerase/epimerase [Acidobacteria bacterium]|nr:sugar phosphate isomerase/epimerase [Acidobacteriota bacterium]